MRIELRDERRRKIGRLSVDLALRPTRVPVIESGAHRQSKADPGEPTQASTASAQREAFLNWDSAVDDAGQLRRCVACGCPDLFRDKAFPQVTAFVVVLAFIGAIVGILGLATNLPVLLVMLLVLALDVAILVFSRPRLICYRCRTTFMDMPIARYHRRWDRTRADRYTLVNDTTAATGPALTAPSTTPPGESRGHPTTPTVVRPAPSRSSASPAKGVKGAATTPQRTSEMPARIISDRRSGKEFLA